jgi:hypothetical protein
MRNAASIAKQTRQPPALPTSLKTELRGNFDDPRWHLAQRIAVSRSIGRSPLLSEFLLYVCDQHLRDRASELTEQRIGVRVFGRTEGYNSNDDNIVRNYARTLRKRVDEYFATEGRHEDLKLEIPRGGYVPVFYSRTPEKPLDGEGAHPVPEFAPATLISLPLQEASAASPPRGEVPRELPPQPVESHAKINGRWWLTFSPSISLAFLLIVATLLYLAIHTLSHAWHNATTPASRQIAHSDVLWGQLFQKDRDTFVVPADSGLVIMQGLTRHPVSLGDYVSGSYRTTVSADGLAAGDVNELGTRRYTSIVDLDLVSRLSQLTGIFPERMMIRYARDLRMDDLRSGNAILLGSVDSNPWEELFEQQLNFRFSFDPNSDTAPVILNQRPLAGEQPIYANRHVGSWHNTFGRIAFLPNLDGTGHVLLVGGLNMAGTQAAGDFVLNSALMQPTLEHARTSNGSIRPFEILIETDNVAANSSRPHVVSERIAPL